MSKLLFGTAGSPRNPSNLSTVDGIKRIAELGLDCLEIEFVQGIRMSKETAQQVAAVAANRAIKLSVHAPYFINLNAREPEKVIASQSRLIQSARIASLCGARDIAFHAAFYMGDSPEKVYDTVKKHLAEVLKRLSDEKIEVTMRPEVMGKISQFGTLDELLDLSSEMNSVAPCIDFAHWHARTGKYNSYEESSGVLAKIKKRLGKSALDNMHIHVAGIAYGNKGELNHLNLEDSDFKYAELLRALNDFQVGGLLICESPNLEDDARLLQTTYTNLHNKHG
ncbi:MAG: TIM barrel protein [Chloroflexi bacterium]|nr:TIM barrel protein [Chloroflexota bacterium]